MIHQATHTLMFMWYLHLDSESQDSLRPLMSILIDPEMTALQRSTAYTYIDSWLSKKARGL